MAIINLKQQIAYRYHKSDRVMRFFITPKLVEGTRKISIVTEDIVGNRTIALSVTKILDYFPGPPTNFKATYNSGPKTVTLTWTDPTDSDLSTLRIFSNGGDVNETAPDYETEIGSVASGVQTFTTGVLADGDYIFGIRALDSAGNLEGNVDVLTFINVPNAAIPFKVGFQSLIQDEGEDESVVVGISLADGKVKLEWEYFQDKENATVTIFRIFSDSGTGTVDFSTPLASVVRNTDTNVSLHTFTSGILTNKVKETHKFVVRAETAGGVDDRSTDETTIDLFGQAPMQIEDLTGSVLRALNSEGGIES